jgi:phosphatidate cytidylyltransferase
VDNATAAPAKKPTLLTRVISSLVLAPLTLFAILKGGYLFIGLVLLAVAISYYEWVRLANVSPQRYRTVFIGAFYLAFCFVAYVFLRFDFRQGGWLASSLVLAIWASDTGAYFTGKTIGGPKLAPTISPNKTWAGFGGAMFFCGLMLAVLTAWGAHLPGPMKLAGLTIDTKRVAILFMTGCILGAVGQAGDLFISWFKRRAHLKDTGALIPGHGGILDRIDALLLACPVFYTIAKVWIG